MRFAKWMMGWAAVFALILTGCTEEQKGQVTEMLEASYDTASAIGDYVKYTPEELERGRMDAAWKQFVQVDTAMAGVDTTAEKWEAITVSDVNGGKMLLPLSGRVSGSSVLRTQVLLDRARFSPGSIDGRWGKNTEIALYWLQKREGLRATGQMDEPTFKRIIALAGNPDSLVIAHRLTAEDVKGPFEPVPDDIYEKAKKKGMYYESLSEKLGEMFHASPDLIAQLNPKATLDSLKAGQVVFVPNVLGGLPGTTGNITRLVVSDGGNYLHAVDTTGRVLYHFPTTLGSSYDPSPEGNLKVARIARDPWWHYQPGILAAVPDDREDARIPPGPNNAVGRVWMALSKQHYGIHGTSSPESIGYASSAGCVRLTNWDALFLAEKVKPGIPVEFRDAAEGDRPSADSANVASPKKPGQSKGTTTSV